MSILKVDTINEKTTGNGVQIPGHVIQVQVGGSTGYTTTTSTSFADMMTCSITPTSTSSNVLVLMNVNGIHVNNTSQYATFQLYRDTTLIRNIHGVAGYGVSHIHYNTDFSSNYLDDAVSTTSAVTYRLKWNSSNGITVGVNNYGASNNTTSSTMTLLEIAG